MAEGDGDRMGEIYMAWLETRGGKKEKRKKHVTLMVSWTVAWVKFGGKPIFPVAIFGVDWRDAMF